MTHLWFQKNLRLSAFICGSTKQWLLIIIAVAVILRLGAALLMGDQVEVLPGIYDQVSYDALAHSLLAGQGFTFPTDWWPLTGAGEPTAHWSYLYTLYLAGVCTLFGPHPLIARLIQAIVGGILGPWLVYRIGRRVFGLTAGLVIAILILPWTVRNYRAFDRFVLLNTNAGFAFYWANHPIYGTNFTSLLPAGGPSYQDLIPAELRDLDEAALDQALLRRGIGFVLDDPGRYALLSLSRVKPYFKFWPSPASSLTSNVSRVLSFGLYLPFMIYGLVLSVKDRRSDRSSL